MRLGNLDALKRAIEDRIDNIPSNDYDEGWNAAINTAIDEIDNAPTVEPTFGLFRTMLCETCQAYATNRAIAKLADEYTRPQGEWIFEKADNESIDGYICSNCGRSYHTKVPYFSEFNYCPNCGAQMNGGEDHD